MENSQKYLDYLFSHIEYEHIELDSLEMFGTTELLELSLENLRKLAYLYDY